MSRILLIGRHDLGCRALELLLGERTVEATCLPARREDEERRPSLRRSAAALGASAFPPSTPLSEAIAAAKPDLVVSAGYDRIISAETIAAAPRIVNVHFGMLPRYRGCFSIPWAILNDEPEIGVTLHDVAPGIDDGPIVAQARIANELTLTCRDLYDRAVEVGAMLVQDFVRQLAAGDAPQGTPQDETRATYYGASYPGGFSAPWRQTAAYAVNYIRAACFPPYDGAFSTIEGRRVVFGWPVEILLVPPEAPPGRIVARSGRIGVATLNGLILPGPVSCDGEAGDFAQLAKARGWLDRTFA